MTKAFVLVVDVVPLAFLVKGLALLRGFGKSDGAYGTTEPNGMLSTHGAEN